MARYAVALVDEQPLFLSALAALFKSDDGFHVVAQGKTADDAVAIATAHAPNLLVMDINLSGDCFAAIAAVARLPAKPKVVALTASASVDSAVRALHCGASGYVLKSSTADELLAAIHSVSRGETFINPCFASAVIAALRQAAIRRVSAHSARLSAREDQIVQQLLRGQTNREIADSLSISEKTVKHYMTILMQKLNARNRLEVVIAAQKLGTIDDPATRYSN
jgi:DNA-binding NarL/FixJ family response regulator